MWATWKQLLFQNISLLLSSVWCMAGWIFSYETRRVGGSCCGGCDLTKAAFPPTNPSLATWTTAQPPQITLLLSSLSLSLMRDARTPSCCLSHIHTLHAPCSVIAGIFHSAAGEHCSQLCCQLQYMLESQRLFADTSFLPAPFSWFSSCA